ncbi:MAG TPA: phosphoribosylanthranilate isomerase [Kofleriaceae bacterium]
MTRVKICGVLDDAGVLVGVDYVGLNLWPSSKRYASLEVARAVAGDSDLGLAPDGARARNPRLVGVFVNPSIDDLANAIEALPLGVIQLHGDETPEAVADAARHTGLPVWKAISIRSAESLDGLDRWPADALVLDAPVPGRGGAGVTFDWTLAAAARHRYPDRKIVLAGGLTPDNVAEAIAIVQPWAVDVASGVETAPGRKDPAKVAAFVAAVRASR